MQSEKLCACDGDEEIYSAECDDDILRYSVLRLWQGHTHPKTTSQLHYSKIRQKIVFTVTITVAITEVQCSAYCTALTQWSILHK